MSYTTLDEYQRKWIFTHQSMPLPAEDLEKIKPMTQARASQFWKENVSPQSPDAERLSPQDWPSKASNWNVLETKWAVFQKLWKNFLFYDDGPILLGRRRSEALWFATNGTVKIGNRA